MTGRVVLCGAGPGDPDLLTVRAAREIAAAEVLLFDALVSSVIVDLASPDCERVDVGKRGDGSRGVSQNDIIAVMIERARAGRFVVRLKGGDPFVFGRGGEEASALRAAGIPFEVVPGISSAIAVPAYAGIPLTDRRLSSSFTVITGHRGKSVDDERTDWEGLARSSETLVVLMGTAWLDDITARVMRGGKDASTPAAIISQGTTARQRSLCVPLGELAERAREAGIGPPAVIVIGRVAELGPELRWFEDRPLFARRVLLLGEAGAQTELALALAGAGAEPIAVPVLAFAPVEGSATCALRDALAGGHDLWILTSARTVDYVRPHLADLPHVPPTVCIGDNTARAARAAGLRVEGTPVRGGPDGLLACLAERGVAGRRLLIPRSARATDVLPARLRAAGATVDCVDAYRNVEPAGLRERLRAVAAKGVDAAVFTSPSSVDRVVDALADAFPAFARDVACVAIGDTTAAALRERGVKNVSVAAEPSTGGLLRAVERYHAGSEVP